MPPKAVWSAINCILLQGDGSPCARFDEEEMKMLPCGSGAANTMRSSESSTGRLSVRLDIP